MKTPPPGHVSSLRGYLLPLDSLRGFIAVLIAFVYHAGHRGFDVPSLFPSPMSGAVRLLGSYGGQFVHFFFMLSGFVFYYNYRKRIEDKQVDLQEFALLRFSRLYPLCWLIIILQAVVMLFWKAIWGGNPYGRGYTASIYEFILSLLFLNTTSITMYRPSFTPVLWTVSYEIVMYLVFFLVATKSKRKNGLLLYVLPVIVGILAVNGRAGVFGDILNAVGFGASYAAVLMSFFIGCLLCELYKHSCNNQAGKIVGYIACILSAVIPLLDRYYPEILGDQLRVFQLVWFPSIILSALCIERISSFLSLKPFRWLGKLSFSIYVWHLLIDDIIESILLYVGLGNYVSSWRIYIVWITTTFIISELSFACFEKPIQKIIRDKYYTWRSVNQEV